MFPCDYVARCLDINISSRSHITTSLSEPSYFITKRTVNKCKVAIEYCVQAGTKRLKWNIIIRYNIGEDNNIFANKITKLV